MTAVETDGPYAGYTCASTKHEHHKDVSDSIYHQSKLQAQLYLDLHKLGFYINSPDEYFFYGANKNGTVTKILKQIFLKIKLNVKIRTLLKS